MRPRRRGDCPYRSRLATDLDTKPGEMDDNKGDGTRRLGLRNPAHLHL